MATDEEIKYLANLLHSTGCHFNHTDQCGWGYEYEREVVDSTYIPGSKVTQPKSGSDGRTITNWSGYEHKRYYQRAKRIIDSLDPDVPPGVIVMVLEAVGSSR